MPDIKIDDNCLFEDLLDQAWGSSFMAMAAVAQGIGSWQACHEFEPSTTKDPPCSGAMPPIGVVVRRGGCSSGVVLVT
ncbi:hypothetical protein TNCV_1123491 [Trichonephila clavipes]|uniref:Uncharacterized protein n=1 Tax=Trichonephila clavipes TaxID=2585209 RepID=A0A8X6SKM6_TRICX|nr:hypothetical protein TNCV_1123491 [Trichonephila clavipes]